MTDRKYSDITSRPMSFASHSSSGFKYGIYSPHGLAHIPPGVITKVGTFRTQKSILKMTSDRLVCLCCSKKNQCYCKKCTLEKLKLYSRKENISMRTIKKLEFEKEVEDILGAIVCSILFLTQLCRSICILQSDVHAEINITTANISLLRKWVSEKKEINKIKSEQVVMMRQMIATTTRHTEKVVAYNNKHEFTELQLQKRRAHKEAKVEEMNQQLSLIRKALCGSLFSIFPVSEVVVHAVNPENGGKNASAHSTGKWTVVSGHQIEEGPMIKLSNTFSLVRDTFLSDAARERLGSALSNSVLSLATDLRSSFAALLHSFQLVNNIATIFDFRLPYSLSHREISLRERWSQELLDNDWFKFCQSVLSLGLHLGMSPESLHFNCPHSNIIEQARFVIEGGAIPKPHPIIIANNRRFEINKSVSLMNVDERELISEWDTCEDLGL
ncbi:hypothetical protein DICVIV_06751 [Dictyocaulus viviparus]|uniref:Uncharacterized protein n=1 Tax=Dictyocaulus viviparus TaxID=29172 RepID=A0A0D8XR68_DICVI|nr:hypothetical protein DICVIV_06751 [Dictyocaulus viviparus]